MDGEVSTSQIFGLLTGLVGCVILSIWSCFLKRSIDKAQPTLVFNTKGELNHGPDDDVSVKNNEIHSSLSEAREAASTPTNTSKPAPAIVPDWSTLSPQAGATLA